MLTCHPAHHRGSPRLIRNTALAVLLFACVLAGGCQGRGQDQREGQSPAPLRKFEFVQPKWGSGFRIVMYAADQQTADAAAAAAFARVDEMTPALSDYDPKSELSRLSQRTGEGPMVEPVAVSEDLFRLLQAGVEASKLTGGAFDVTVGPSVRLWRRSRDQGQLPRERRIEEARQSVGSQHLRLDPRKKTVQLLAPRMRLDLGGIAAGYAADEMREVIRRHGINRVLVDAAGDLA